MPQIDRAYMALALALLIAGEMLGFYVGMKADSTWRLVHITLVLPGFVTMAIFATIFRLWPTMKRGTLASAQFWITFTGLVAIVAGEVQRTLSGSVLVLALGSAVMIAGTLLLAWLFWDRASA
jgi:hypothetical protein